MNISNHKTLEAIGIQLLSSGGLDLLKKYKLQVALSKQSELNIFTEYGNKLCTEGKCVLPSQAVSEIFAKILKYANEDISSSFLRTFMNNIPSIDYQKALGLYTLTGKTKSDPIFIHKILPGIYLGKWDMEQLKRNLPFRKQLIDFLSDGNVRKALRDATKPLNQNLLLTIDALDKDSSLLVGSKKLQLLSQVCRLPQDGQPFSVLEMSHNLRTLRFICSLKLTSSLDHEFSKSASEELSIAFKQVAIQNSLVPDLAQIENIEEKYMDTFVTKALIPGSLTTYESGFRSLDHSSRKFIFEKGFLSDFTRFVHMCLDKTPNERYRLEINPNLQRLSERFPTVFERWKESLPPIELESSPKPLPSKALKGFNFIPLVEAELKEYKESPSVTAISTNLKALSKASSSQEQTELLTLIEKDLSQLDPLPMDALKSVEQALSRLKTEGGKQKLIVKDIDDPLTLFEMPTLVCHSCQNITANPIYNHCLVGYSIEGATRMIAVQDSKGNYVARSVLRICMDENSLPFLLLEPVYLSSKISQEEAQQDIYEGAIQKSEALNIPLFTKVSDSLGLTKKIISKGGAATTYYSDFSVDKEGEHRILGKIPQELTTLPIFQMSRDQFQRPAFWDRSTKKE